MGLFSRRKTEEQPIQIPATVDYRKHVRTDLTHDSDRYEAELEGRRCALRNLSEGGVALSADNASTPGRGIMTLYRNGVAVRRSYAMRCWGRGQTIGYKLSAKQPLSGSELSEAEVAELRARGIKRRMAAEIARRNGH